MATSPSRRLSVVRVSAAAGVGLAILMSLCWVGTFVPFSSPTHAFVTLFTRAELHSTRALFEGTLWAGLFGLLAGAILAVVYNLLARLEK